MKKTLSLVTIITLALTLLVSPINASAVTNPLTGKGNNNKVTKTTAVELYGRFAVASAGIDVALYKSFTQAVCDAEDSACFYNNNGMIIADHAYQAFKTLKTVQVGDIATITRVDGSVITLQCAEAYDGHNAGSTITNADGASVTGQHSYLSYTCLDSTGYNVRVVQWDTLSDTAVTNTTTTAPTTTKTKGNGNSKKDTISDTAATNTTTTAPSTEKTKGNGNSKKNK